MLKATTASSVCSLADSCEIEIPCFNQKRWKQGATLASTPWKEWNFFVSLRVLCGNLILVCKTSVFFLHRDSCGFACGHWAFVKSMSHSNMQLWPSHMWHFYTSDRLLTGCDIWDIFFLFFFSSSPCLWIKICFVVWPWDPFWTTQVESRENNVLKNTQNKRNWKVKEQRDLRQTNLHWQWHTGEHIWFPILVFDGSMLFRCNKSQEVWQPRKEKRTKMRTKQQSMLEHEMQKEHGQFDHGCLIMTLTRKNAPWTVPKDHVWVFLSSKTTMLWCNLIVCWMWWWNLFQAQRVITFCCSIFVAKASHTMLARELTNVSKTIFLPTWSDNSLWGTNNLTRASKIPTNPQHTHVSWGRLA